MKDSKLRELGFLEAATDALKELMTSLARSIQLKKGQTLFEQGDVGETLFALESGRLEVSVLSSDGRKLSLNILQAGALFGEIALFDPGPRTATVIALEPSRVWGVRNADVIAALRNNPDLLFDMIQLAGKRMRWMDTQLNEQVFLSMPTRLARKILHLTRHDTGDSQVLRMSQNDLAEFVGASREAVSKTLSVWKREGVISLNRGTLEVLDRPALQEISELMIF